MDGIKQLKPLRFKKFLSYPYSNPHKITKNANALLYFLRYYSRLDPSYLQDISTEILAEKAKISKGNHLRNILNLILHYSVPPSFIFPGSAPPIVKFSGRTQEMSPVKPILQSLEQNCKGRSLGDPCTDLEDYLAKLSEFENLTLSQSAALMEGFARANYDAPKIWHKLLALSPLEDLTETRIIRLISMLTSLALVRLFKWWPEEEKSAAEDIILKLKQAFLANKEVLTSDEMVAILYYLKRLERLDLAYLEEFEPKLIEKANLIKTEDLLKVCKIYHKFELNPSRVTFFRELKNLFARRLEDGEHTHASDFLDFEAALQSMGIRTSLSSNNLVESSFSTNNIALYKSMILAKLRGQPYLSIGQQCALYQVQILNQINKIGPSVLKEIVRFFAVHGEISNEFAENILRTAQKALADKTPNKHFNRVDWVLIIRLIISAKKQFAKNVKVNLSQHLLEGIWSHLQVIPPAVWLEAFSGYVWKKADFEIDFLEKLADNFDRLSDEVKIMIAYAICGRANHEGLNHVVSLFVEDLYTIFSITELCYALPFIMSSTEIPEEEKSKILNKIFHSKLNLEELRAILQHLDSIPEQFMKDVTSKLEAMKSVDVHELETFLEVFEIVLKDSKRFDEKFCKNLLELISQNNYVLNQRKLDNLVELYTQRNIK